MDIEGLAIVKSMKQLGLTVLSGGVLLLLFASRGGADPILSSSVAALADGSFQYTYSLTDADPADDIYDFSLGPFAGDPTNFSGDPSLDKITSPTGWSGIPFYDPGTNSGSVDWLSTSLPGDNPTYDLVPGETLMFTLLSLYGPGDVTFALLDSNHTDPVLGGPLTTSGTTTGPVQGVPEPSTWILLAAGFGFLWSQRRRLAPTL